MADGSIKKVLPSRLGAVETVYAMTVHKSQGAEFDHTALVTPDTMSPVLTQELIYTGITRARFFLTKIVISNSKFGKIEIKKSHKKVISVKKISICYGMLE